MSDDLRTTPEPDHDPRGSEDGYLADLGRRVRHMRSLRGMSRKTLSQAAHVSERYLADLESGAGNFSITLLRRVAHAMAVNLSDLVAEEPIPETWRVLRELLKAARPDAIERARRLLSGGSDVSGHAGAPVERVALIGLRGAGKSTLGKMAADELGWTFVELNTVVEEIAGLSVTEVFKLYGQEGYRRLEQRALQALIDRPGPLLVAAGGGIVAEPLTFETLLSSFYTIWLRARPEQHMARVRDQGDLRPMANDRTAMDELVAILTSRDELYRRANAVLDTENEDIPANVAALVALIRSAKAP